MPNSENAKLMYEAGRDFTDFTALSDKGDHKQFDSAVNFWSMYSGKEPDVRPNGLINGGAITPAASLTNNYVDIAALKCYLAGVETDVAADADVDCARPDGTYLVLSFASGGYTDCVAGDIGKTVTGGVTGDTGTLIAYDNTNRKWIVDQTAPEDTFDDDDEAITIATGTGAGTLDAVGAACTHKILSITVNSSGAIAVVAGTEFTSFSSTRGALGGPPWIPTTSIEIGQVKYTGSTAAVVAASEIKDVPNTHTEWSNYPVFDKYPIRVSNQVADYAGITFNAALPQIHSDDAGTTTSGKKVYASYYEPQMAEAPDVENFVPPKNSHSVGSKQVYGRTLGSTSRNLDQGSFTKYSEDGITDNLLKEEDQILLFQFYQDRLKTPYIVCQGTFGAGYAFPAADLISHACTISAGLKGENVAS